MKVHELKTILEGFDPGDVVEIQAPDNDILEIGEVKEMMGCSVVVQPGGFIEITDSDLANSTSICFIVTRRLSNAA